MRKPRVLIIGAGPAGASCAYQLSRRGTAEVVLIDKSRYPRLKVCGSGLSPLALNVLDRLDLRERFAGRHSVIRALRIEGRAGRHVRLVAGDGAWVVPRTEFDYGLVKAAEEHGTRFQPETKAVSLLRDPDGRARGAHTDVGDIEADLVICADGAPSRFSTDRSPRHTIQTLMGWWRGVDLPDGEAVMVWDRRLDGYYAWAFPEPGGVVNIGLTIPDGAPGASRLKPLFQELLDEYFAARLKGAELVGKWMGHPAVITRSIGATSEKNALWIGEAARLVMPGTVEGIGFALEDGVAAADHVAQHFQPSHTFAPAAALTHRAATSIRVLPKFWAGEAWVRMMRSENARRATAAVVTSPLLPMVQNAIATVVGDGKATGVART